MFTYILKRKKTLEKAIFPEVQFNVVSFWLTLSQTTANFRFKGFMLLSFGNRDLSFTKIKVC